MDANYPDVVLRPGGGNRRCRVVYSYTPQNDDELELQVEDEIEFLEEVEEGWWRGKLKTHVGVFPSNFVEEIPTASDEPSLSEGDLSAPLSPPEEQVPALPPKPVKELCRVIYPYEGAVEDELTLKKDDIVTIITKIVEDKGWWMGELRGKIGLFPDNFVEIISPVDDSTSPQNKKPERPAKSLVEPKIDTRIPLISSVLGSKKLEQEATTNNTTAPNDSETKRRSADLDLIKPDTVASHRKSLEQKVANEVPVLAGKKPPVSGKPKPTAAAKPGKLRGGVLSDSTDGALPSKMAAARKSLDSSEAEDLDLDSVGRSDMLSHITASRPRAPGRRPPSVFKENENVSPITNGNSEIPEAEKLATKENKWEKHKPPFMDELKVNLKSSKPATDAKGEKKTSPLGLWGSKVGSFSSLETSTVHSTASNQETINKLSVTSSVTDVRQSSATSSVIKSAVTSSASDVRQSSASASVIKSAVTSSVAEVRPPSATSNSSSNHRLETISSKISELSSVFADKSKGSSSLSTDSTSHEYASKKEAHDLRLKVDKLEKMVADLASQLREEADRRRLLEKELNKLTDLVTQV